VILDYQDLVNKADLTAAVEKAFGASGLGILAVKGVPNLTNCRQELLPLAFRYANLPDSVKEKTVHPESFYSFGWSHGKEMFAKGIPDLSKGSYYNNPIHDVPYEDPLLIKQFPSFCHPNIWPDDLPELRQAFMNMGKLVVDVGILLAHQCDKLVNKYFAGAGKLEEIIVNTRNHKARLLHYFPLEKYQQEFQKNGGMQDDWCGWHNDHGSLTGLLSALYLDASGNEVTKPDPSAGLYIRSRDHQLVKVSIPSDHLIFQIGETAQIHSGGLLRATPHCVRGPQGSSEGISRETFAVFMEPRWDYPLDAPNGVSEVDVYLNGEDSMPKGIPKLSTRWKTGMDFGGFSKVTLEGYYAY